MIKLFIVDDHQIVIDGIKALLRDIEHIEVVGDALNGVTLINRIPALKPDIILMDIGMPVMDGIEASKQVKEKYPEIKILICTTYSEPYKIKKLLKIGVEGYLLKGSGRATLIEAIESIIDGNTYHDKRVVEVLMNSFYAPKSTTNISLTKREIEIVKFVAEGMNTKEIAELLFLSPLTVETHRKNIFSKLGINKVASLIRYAMKEGLID